MDLLQKTHTGNSGASDMSSYSLRSEDPDSIAEEVQQLNADVMQAVMMEDDLIGGDAVKRTLSRNRRKSTTSRDEDEEEKLAMDTTTNTEDAARILPRRRSTIAETIKRTSTFQKIAKIGFWDTEFKRQRIKVYTTFLTNYLVLSIVLTLVLSLMWGTYYHRERRYKNMKIIVVNDDLPQDGITPIIGNAVNHTLSLSTVKDYGGWTLFTHDEFAEQAAKHNNTYREELERLVHHQEYWGALYVHPNVTHQFYSAIVSNDTSFTVTGSLVEVIYETGRDFLTVGSYVVSFFQLFESSFMQVLKTGYYQTLISELPDDESKLNAISFISSPMSVLYTDNRPTNAILMAPLQLGLTYLVVFTFFQLLLTITIQIYLASIVKGVKYLVVRALVSQVAYIFIGGAFVVLNMCFQINVTNTFGNGGGFVLWVIAYLTMSSLGALNEVMASLLFTYYPPLIGGWLVMLMALNSAPTTSPLVLASPFYRYGYAMPIHNSYELAKVVFSDSYKGQMGRNFGILVAWIVLWNAVLPFVLIHVSAVRERRERQAMEKAEEGVPST